MSSKRRHAALIEMVVCVLVLVSGPAYGNDATAEAPVVARVDRTVFVIVMENHDWDTIAGNPSAPYINQTLLPIAAHAERYYNPPNLHPSEPNYLWLEAGTNFGVLDDLPPAVNHQHTSAHLTTLLDQAGISWKTYQEGISGQDCPLASFGHYAVKHNPMLFFDDVTDTNNPHSAYCITHVRPYAEFAGDLTHNMAARYNFITPDVCDDMHDRLGCETLDSIRNGDRWLASEVPQILASQAYQNGGRLIITWDESEGEEQPIGLIVLSPDARAGYSNTVHYTHSSTLRTIEEWFGVTPFLGDAANAIDFGDLFKAGTF